MSNQYEEFFTHNEELVTDQDRLKTAYGAVADVLVDMARGELKEDLYAKHVTKQDKLDRLQNKLDEAEMVRSGETTANDKFWLWQMVNQELTGVCVPLFHCED